MFYLIFQITKFMENISVYAFPGLPKEVSYFSKHIYRAKSKVVVDAVLDYFKLEKVALYSEEMQSQETVYVKKMIVYFLRKHTTLTRIAMSHEIGKNHHSYPIYYLKRLLIERKEPKSTIDADIEKLGAIIEIKLSENGNNKQGNTGVCCL